MTFRKMQEQNNKLLEHECKIDFLNSRINILENIFNEHVLTIKQIKKKYQSITQKENKLKKFIQKIDLIDNPCIICMKKNKNVSLIHGNTAHILCCNECAEFLEKCPICREPIEKIVTNYYS